MARQRPPAALKVRGWFHRRSAEQSRAEREATLAANQAERRRKQTYAVRREHVGYRFSMFKAQAARRGKEVELRQLDFAKLLRRPCLYCGATQRIVSSSNMVPEMPTSRDAACERRVPS